MQFPVARLTRPGRVFQPTDNCVGVFGSDDQIRPAVRFTSSGRANIQRRPSDAARASVFRTGVGQILLTRLRSQWTKRCSPCLRRRKQHPSCHPHPGRRKRVLHAPNRSDGDRWPGVSAFWDRGQVDGHGTAFLPARGDIRKTVPVDIGQPDTVGSPLAGGAIAASTVCRFKGRPTSLPRLREEGRGFALLCSLLVEGLEWNSSRKALALHQCLSSRHDFRMRVGDVL